MTENPAYIPYLEPHTFGELRPEQVIEKMRKSGKGVRPEDWKRRFSDQPPELFRDRGDLELTQEGGLALWKAVPRAPKEHQATPEGVAVVERTEE